MGLRVNTNRVGALLEYICSLMPHIHLRKLLKVVYLVDEKSVKMRAIPLTWLDYYAWKKGPVAPLVYDVKNGEFSDFVICTKEADGKEIYADALDSAIMQAAMYRSKRTPKKYKPYLEKVLEDAYSK